MLFVDEADAFRRKGSDARSAMTEQLCVAIGAFHLRTCFARVARRTAHSPQSRSLHEVHGRDVPYAVLMRARCLPAWLRSSRP